MDLKFATPRFTETKHWFVSPFWATFIFVLSVGILAYFVFPFFAPGLFRVGMIKLLKDPFYFHDLAVQVANAPWSEFTLRPDKQFPSGVLGLIYKVSGIYQPFMMLPVLGILAGITTRSIVGCLDVLGITGRLWPLLIAIVFCVTPTSITWMMYPHKESFIVPGIILISWAFLSTSVKGFDWKNSVIFLIGCLLVLTTKTYFTELLSTGTFLVLLISLFQKNTAGKNKIFFFLISLIGFVSFLYISRVNMAFRDNEGLAHMAVAKASNEEGKPVITRPVFQSDNWKSMPGGELINAPLRILAFTRERFLGAGGRTNFLPEVTLKGGYETIMFLPRAMQLAILEPLPWRSYEQPTANKVVFFVAQLEMVLVYLSILFLLWAGFKNWSPQVLICIGIALPALVAFGYVMPNIGSINRYRFPFLVLIKIAGLKALWNSSRFKYPGRLLTWIDPSEIPRTKKKVLFLAPDDITFIIQRLVMAQGVQKAGYEVHLAAEDTGSSQKLRELGFIFHPLNLNRGGLNPLADFKPFTKLVFLLSRERPDILQCVSIKPVLYGAIAGAIVGLKRIVCLVNGLGHAFEGHDLKGRMIKQIASTLYRNALSLPGVRVIFQNPDDRAYFVENRLVDENKTVLIRGSGVDMEKFKPTPQPSNSRPVVLFVGRLLWNKGIRELAEASRQLKLEKMDFTLKIVGGPDHRNPEAVPEEYLRKLHEEGIIDWVGRQSDMPKFYREADIVCLPTQYKEGLPLTLLEAASTGRPLISTDAPGCREIVRPDINGYLVPPKNTLALVDALRILISDSNVRKCFGEASTKIVREEFSAEIIQGQLVTVYESLLNDSMPSSNNLSQC
jgi:glycosyltransferase involved in cell wall biosynthesis